MLPRRFVALVLAVVASLTACGSSGDTDSGVGSATVDGDLVAVGDAPLPDAGVGSLGEAVEIAAAAPGDAADAACTVDRQTLQLAAESYEILNGALPTSQQELLDAQIIRELSVRFEITAEGAVVAAPGSPCS